MVLGRKISPFVLLCLECFYFPEQTRAAADNCNKRRFNSLGYIEIEEIDKCLWFSEVLATWYEASESCADRLGRLYTAHHTSQLLPEFLIPYKNRHENFWIGLNDIETEGEYMWNLGSGEDHELGLASAQILPWRDGQPNNAEANEDCVMKSSDGTWQNLPCTSKLRYICEAETDNAGIDALAEQHDKENDEEESMDNNWAVWVIVLFVLMGVIPATVQLIAKLIVNKRKENEPVEEPSLFSHMSTGLNSDSTGSFSPTSRSTTTSSRSRSPTVASSSSDTTNTFPAKTKRKVSFLADETSSSEETSATSTYV